MFQIFNNMLNLINCEYYFVKMYNTYYLVTSLVIIN